MKLTASLVVQHAIDDLLLLQIMTSLGEFWNKIHLSMYVIDSETSHNGRYFLMENGKVPSMNN